MGIDYLVDWLLMRPVQTQIQNMQFVFLCLHTIQTMACQHKIACLQSLMYPEQRQQGHSKLKYEAMLAEMNAEIVTLMTSTLSKNIIQ